MDSNLTKDVKFYVLFKVKETPLSSCEIHGVYINYTILKVKRLDYKN